MLKSKLKLAYLFLLFFILAFTLKPLAAEPIVPMVEAVYPAFGAADIDTLAEIKITFNSPMDKKSVERNFNIYPEIKGQMRWEANTLIFKPETALLPSTSYFVSLMPQIKAAQGIPLAVTYFSTPAEGVCVGPNGNLRIVSINSGTREIEVRGVNPVWSADNQSIIYESEGRLWRVDAQGRNPTQLISDEESYTAGQPQVNYFADLIAFVGSNAAGTANVYTVDSQVNIPRQLTSFFEPGEIKFLRWSPDGLYLAFLRAGQIWIMDREGKDLKKITNDELICRGNFAWSPGGTKIAFTGDKNVWIGDIYAASLKKTSFDSAETGSLDWSADNRIVFESDGLTLMSADGSDEVRVATAAQNPLWIDRGKLLSFVLDLHNDTHTAQIWTMSADGQEKIKIGEISADHPEISWSRNVGFSGLFSS